MDEGLAQVPVPVAELAAQQSDPPVVSQEQAASADIEAGTVVKVKRKRKTTQNDHSHGSFFLRIGAIGKFFFTKPPLSYSTTHIHCLQHSVWGL